MLTIEQTELFASWLRHLRDQVAKAKIAARIRRLAMGNPGDVRPVGEGVSELRIDHGPGYRVYFCRTGQTVMVLLCGGDKAGQTKDIEQAKAMARQCKEHDR